LFGIVTEKMKRVCVGIGRDPVECSAYCSATPVFEHLQIIPSEKFFLNLRLLCINTTNTIILKTNLNKYHETNSIIHSIYSINDFINGK